MNTCYCKLQDIYRILTNIQGCNVQTNLFYIVLIDSQVSQTYRIAYNRGSFLAASMFSFFIVFDVFKTGSPRASASLEHYVASKS